MDNSAQAKKKYQKMVDQTSPGSKTTANAVKAFFTGGLICALGQFVSNTLTSHGVERDAAAIYTAIILIFLGVLLTGLGVYDKIGKFAGAGTVVPITGFANSMAAPAVEYKKEGLIMGVGAKMFLVAGPVIVYGTLSAFAVGIVYYFLR